MGKQMPTCFTVLQATHKLDIAAFLRTMGSISRVCMTTRESIRMQSRTSTFVPAVPSLVD